LIARLTSAGVAMVLFDCTVDTDVPVYMAYLHDLRVQGLGIYRGYGAHLDPEVAMVRAITEAAQGRVIYIAGSRDDVFRHSYVRLKQPDDNMMAPAMRSLPATVDVRQRASEATSTFEGDTQIAIRKLKEAGLRQAIVVDLSRPGMPFNVVKIVVPGLEGYMFDFYAPGRRALEYAKRRQLEIGNLSGAHASD